MGPELGVLGPDVALVLRDDHPADGQAETAAGAVLPAGIGSVFFENIVPGARPGWRGPESTDIDAISVRFLA